MAVVGNLPPTEKTSIISNIEIIIIIQLSESFDLSWLLKITRGLYFYVNVAFYMTNPTRYHEMTDDSKVGLWFKVE